MQNVVLFKIFYDEKSLRQVEADFLPLDNRQGPEGWFELWPILNYLEHNEISEDTWYGFFSPKFPDKAHLSLQSVYHVLSANPQADVALFSYDWPSIVTFRNAWVQGERYHPGLIASFEAFLLTRGETVDLRRVVGDFETTVFSNYIIAKRNYWIAWRQLARAYFDYANSSGSELADNKTTQYSGRQGYPIRVFVQERLACWLLHTGTFRVVHPPYTKSVLSGGFFAVGGSRAMGITLALAEAAKRLARKSGWEVFMALHWVFLKLTELIYRFRRSVSKATIEGGRP